MPAAFYDFNVEQSSDFMSGLKILKPEDGSLFKFLPNPGEPFWKDANTLNFDVPNEIKLLYPSDTSSFGYLKNTAAVLQFLTIRMSVKTNTGSLVLYGETRCDKKANPTPANPSFDYVTQTSWTTTTGWNIPSTVSPINFSFPRNASTDNNLLMHIGNVSTTPFKGKYLYDVEMQYTVASTQFVIRLLQGRVTFNPNITT